jgi:hypothetical protein
LSAKARPKRRRIAVCRRNQCPQSGLDGEVAAHTWCVLVSLVLVLPIYFHANAVAYAIYIYTIFVSAHVILLGLV